MRSYSVLFLAALLAVVFCVGDAQAFGRRKKKSCSSTGSCSVSNTSTTTTTNSFSQGTACAGGVCRPVAR